ncbi:TetR/AcrR family transcriptional regulator [Virgibacillus necropolis]|uniref:TetR family transcriptional regulator n=1 Tax=Virgibacillus necropolis TaxID=163877 RepID=A0A221MCH5_9BACI|nr:TetR/AcrR family transcriptional regulator [Virgibacillus necropolis]ASN05334.1 TetR family transcriptional regulator [Virgibacillus necropolis]
MKNELTKQSILLFEKKGFNQTSIQDIVNALDVTKGTFYYYFASKEQLLMDIHHDYITNLLKRQYGILDDEHLTQKEKLMKIIHLLITDIADQGPSARVFFREIRYLSDENIETIKQKRNQFRLNIQKVIEEGSKLGEFHNELRADMLSFGILGVTNWSYNWYKTNGEVSPDELTKIYADMILTGIAKRR